MMIRPLAILICLLAPVSWLRAEALDRRQVPAAAAWLIHLDADAAQASFLGQRLRDLCLARPESAAAIQKARDTFGIDLTRDIHSITVYGTDYAPDAGVVLVRAKFDRTRIESVLDKLPNYRSETDSGRTIYFWTETDPNRRRNSAGTFFGPDLIVIAPDRQAVLSAVGVLDGQVPALSDNSPLAIPDMPGAIVQAAATGLSNARQLPIQSPVVRQCESGSLTVGELNGQAFVHGKVVTRSAETARNAGDLILGGRAMAKLQNPDNDTLARLLDAMSVTVKDKTIEIQWQYSSIDLVRIVVTEQAKRAAATQPGTEK